MADTGFKISTEKVVNYLCCTGDFASAVKEVAGRELTVAAAKQKGLKVTDEELQKASDAWRALHGLFNAQSTMNWLAANGLTIESYEDFLAANLLISKFKQALASEAQIEKIFLDPQCRDAALELLYSNWLAGAMGK